MNTFFLILISSFAISYWVELSRAGGWVKHAIIFLGATSTCIFYPATWFLIPIIFATAFLSTVWIILVNGVTSKPQVIRRR
jgi:hypothetical protein